MSEPAGTSFRAKEVVDHYRYRPAYPSAVFDRILEFSPARSCLVDLGCGEGKVARPMTDFFDQVVAVDPSENMLRLGKTLPKGDVKNITWVQAVAEGAPLPGEIDVVTFASSIHWMEPAKLFSKLKKNLSTQHILAVIQGDEPFEPTWHREWRKFLARWVPKITGRPVDSTEWVGSRNRHLEYMEVIHSSDCVSMPIKQSVEEFVLCQHSRDTFAIPRLGSRLTDFREELVALLRPHSDQADQLEFQVKTHLTIGKLSS